MSLQGEIYMAEIYMANLTDFIPGDMCTEVEEVSYQRGPFKFTLRNRF